MENMTKIEKMQYDLIYNYISLNFFLEQEFKKLDNLVKSGIEEKSITGESVEFLNSFLNSFEKQKESIEENKQQFCEMVFKISKMDFVKLNWLTGMNTLMIKELLNHFKIPFEDCENNKPIDIV
jgi:hypothetical protein